MMSNFYEVGHDARSLDPSPQGRVDAGRISKSYDVDHTMPSCY